jgi:hypothetical protein
LVILAASLPRDKAILEGFISRGEVEEEEVIRSFCEWYSDWMGMDSYVEFGKKE